MMTIWKSIIQPKLDYCSQLWSPSDQASIALLEGVQRNFTSKIVGMDGKDYIERLSSLKMYSQERRRERYQLIFIWKISQGLVQGYSLEFSNSERRGRMVVPHPAQRHATQSRASFLLSNTLTNICSHIYIYLKFKLFQILWKSRLVIQAKIPSIS